MDIGPRRDLVGDLAKEVKAQTSPQTQLPLKFGVYHSLLEWFNPLYLLDHANNYSTHYFVDAKAMPELYDLVLKYEPELIWSDGDWDSHSDYWHAKEFLAWYATHSTVADTAVWNDRWGKDALCQHGSFLTCQDKYQPGKYVERKWENAMTIDVSSWGWNRNATYSKYLTTKSLIHTLIETIAFHGNLLLNVGPAADGTISPIFIDRLMGMGEWLQVNGVAVYKSRSWSVCQQEPPNATVVPVFYTTRPENQTLYAIFTEWPHGNVLTLTCPQAVVVVSDGDGATMMTTRISLLGLADMVAAKRILEKNEREDDDGRKKLVLGLYDDDDGNDDALTDLGNVDFEVIEGGGITVKLPPLTPDIIPCQHAWVLQLSHVMDATAATTATTTVEATITMPKP
jgi:alpha-L-fucosidase